MNLTRVILQALRTQNLPIKISAFTPSSLRQLFPSADSRSPNALNKALFPHLAHQSLSITSSTIFYSSIYVSTETKGNILTKLWSSLEPAVSLVRMPIELARQECNFKRKELEKVRDKKAVALGYLANMRTDLSLAIKGPSNIQSFVCDLTRIVEGDTSKIFTTSSAQGSLSEKLHEVLRLSTAVFSSYTAHQCLMNSKELRRPSRLTLMWPKLLLIPPLCIYALRTAYTSRASLAELVMDVKATAEGFVKGWFLDPLKEVLETVRTGGEDGMIVQKEGIAADFDVSDADRFYVYSSMTSLSSLVSRADGTRFG